MLLSIWIVLAIVGVACLLAGQFLQNKASFIAGWIVILLSGLVIMADGLEVNTGSYLINVTNSTTQVVSETASVPNAGLVIGVVATLVSIAGFFYTVSSFEKGDVVYGEKPFKRKFR